MLSEWAGVITWIFKNVFSHKKQYVRLKSEIPFVLNLFFQIYFLYILIGFLFFFLYQDKYKVDTEEKTHIKCCGFT